MIFKEKINELFETMSLAEKIALCSGADFFNTKAYSQYHIPSIAMADGPHGLRKPANAADQLGVNKSIPSTCFPTASLSACSWDRDLLQEMGAAIGDEALQEGISIVLGPGVNIKRNPLCGRNFEYFSEDPYLSGELGSSWIEGVQSKGVGTSLKHFTANNQEDQRMSSDSIIDERALWEIYLPAFEKAVKQAKPATVMCAYNKLNGVYCSDNNYLLRDILRDEWGYEGVVVTDWGAMNDRIEAFIAGLDLEMPGSEGYFDQDVMAAVRSGALSEERVDESASRILEMVFSYAEKLKPGYKFNVEKHHLLAKKIASNSAVLLKNEDNILPIPNGKKIVLIGAHAETPRYQGAGSSHVNPTKLSSVIDGFDLLGLAYDYFEGYSLTGARNDALRMDAVAGVKDREIVVIAAGLPAEYESEGYDRDSLALPENQNALIAEVADANPNTVVLLFGGAPFEMPWLSKVKAVLNMYLPGQAGGLAAAELLMGIVNPSGKLAESYPIAYTDVPSAGFYETGGKQAQYRESIYVGYRYYDTAQKDVLFPFGHGLSYTSFEYSDLEIAPSDVNSPFTVKISFLVKNTGPVDGAEVAQVYVGAEDSPVFRPQKELKEFEKIYLKSGEAKRVNLMLDARSFAIYDVEKEDWVVPSGKYTILIGSSSRDIRLQGEVVVQGQVIHPQPGLAAWYAHPTGVPTQADFESLLGSPIVPIKQWKKGGYTLECSFNDMKDSFVIRQVIKSIEKRVAKAIGGVEDRNATFTMMISSSTNMPIKNVSQISQADMPKNLASGLVHLANGKFLKGILSILKKPKN